MYFSHIQYGSTALCIASAKGHTEVVELLISRGATVDYQDKVHESVNGICIVVMIVRSVYVNTSFLVVV